MKRPKTNSKKISWFSIAGVFLLAVALAVGASTNAQAATGSLDRDNYLPDLTGSSGNDYDRAWISVTDSTANTTNSADAINVTVKASASHSTSFKLQETGATTTVFTTTGTTQKIMYPVGTTSGYVEDFASGSHNYPALGATVVGLNLKKLTANSGGDATTASDGDLTVSSGDTLQLLYGNSTLDTALVKTNSGSFVFSPSSVSAVTTNNSVSTNLILSVSDPDENLNPVIKDVIGFSDGVVAFAISSDANAIGGAGTGTSRVQIEAIDQITGTTLSVATIPAVTRNIMLVETGNNTGVFSASGKVFSTSTSFQDTNLKGNVRITYGSATSAIVYTGSQLTLGAIADGTGPGAVFRILEVSASGVIALINAGQFPGDGVIPFGTSTLAYKATTSPSTVSFSAYGLNNLGLTRVVAGSSTTPNGHPVSVFGVTSDSTKYATATTNLVKLIDGSNYCLLEITSLQGTSSAAVSAPTATGTVYSAGANGTAMPAGGSLTVTLDGFELVGARSGDTLKVSYLDELRDGGTSGTVTGTAAYGVSGVTGTLDRSATAPDINDRVTITVVDENLNSDSSSAETVGHGAALWSGTTTHRRGDHLRIKNYSPSNRWLDLTTPDGYQIGTTSIRVSSTDNTYVWMVPTATSSSLQFVTVALGASGASFGSSSVQLGTQSVSPVPLVRGSSSGATSFLSSASTSSFIATLDGLDNTVEISPNGTHWVSIPIVETGANSSTFVGTIGFDYTTVRLTTNSTRSVTAVISDHTGTSTLFFQDDDIGGSGLQTFIGTGSVIRIFDGSTQEFAEVCSPGVTTLSVTKLTNSTGFTPYKTWIQVIGNDMMTARLDTASGISFFRLGGYYGATYRLRYNDAVGASGAYLGGDTLAVTTSNMGFTAYSGSLATNITGTAGPNTYVVVTLVDEDLNIATGSVQSTFEKSGATSNNIFWNENGLGVPSGSSTGNLVRGYKNGGTGKIIYASTVSSILSSSVNLSSGGNTIDLKLVETDNNTGTFKGSFRLSSGSTTSNADADNVLQVSNGSSVYVFYNDSPNATAEDNSASYTATSPISIATSLGTLSLSKDTAYITNDTGGGDTIVATVVDIDRNTSLTNADRLDTALKITGANYSIGGSDTIMDLVETGVNTGTFLATITTGTTSIGGGSGVNSATIKAVQDGIANVIYRDTSPAASSATKTLSFSAFNATLDFDAGSYSLGTYALVTLADAEQNTGVTAAQNLLSSVFIQTSSSNSTKIKMTETGVNTGTFKGSIQVASSGDTTEFSKIKAADGDTLTITYIDQTNTTVSSRTVTDTALVAAAATPTPTATPTETATPTATPTVGAITGFVASSALGTAITGATVSTDGFSATTGADGSYTISDVTPGTYTLTASATGFVSASQPVTVTAGVTTTAPTFDLVPVAATPTPTATATATPKPTVTATPVPCEPEKISADPAKSLTLSLSGEDEGEVTVTVSGDDGGCQAAGVTVTATTNTAGAKRISISPASDTTDASGEVVFTMTATGKKGNARVEFTADGVKKPLRYTVKVKK